MLRQWSSTLTDFYLQFHIIINNNNKILLLSICIGLGEHENTFNCFPIQTDNEKVSGIVTANVKDNYTDNN